MGQDLSSGFIVPASVEIYSTITASKETRVEKATMKQARQRKPLASWGMELLMTMVVRERPMVELMQSTATTTTTMLKVKRQTNRWKS